MRYGETSALTRVFSWLLNFEICIPLFYFWRGTEKIRESGKLWQRRVLGIRSFLGGRLRRGFRGGLLMLGELDCFWGGGLEVGGWDFCLGSWVWVREEGGVSVLGFIRFFKRILSLVSHCLNRLSTFLVIPPPPLPPHIPSFPLVFFSNLPSSPQTSNTPPT